MPAGDHRARFPRFFRATTQDLRQDAFVQPLGPSQQVDGHEWLAAHGINIAQGIGGRDGAKVVGIINNRREEIGSGNDRALLIDLVNSRIIWLRQADQNLRKVRLGECSA